MSTDRRLRLESEANLLEFLLTEPLCEKCKAIVQTQYQATCDQIAEDEKDLKLSFEGEHDD
ncbi:hypothetical protein LCGC14_1551650 [marine sediment metagenome]|uniref:Uncharacterized protein n=1 Tax=marine sediment metagenome TaxID=412755 RepID=A0A0F9IQ42_9ZZZZ